MTPPDFSLILAFLRLDEAHAIQKRVLLLYPDRFKWLFNTRNTERLLVAPQNDFWSEVHLVTKGGPDGRLLGAVTATFDLECYTVTATSAQCWAQPEDYSEGATDPEYIADRATFRAARREHLRRLCSRFRWVKWSNAASNPSLPWYRKLAAEFNGKEVGRYAGDFMLGDGTIDDKVIFQIPGSRQ